jgi:hypothetical protein
MVSTYRYVTYNYLVLWIWKVDEWNRLATHHPTYVLSIIHMTLLGQHMMQLLLSIPVQQNHLIGYLRVKNLHGQTLPISSILKLFLFTINQHLFTQKMQCLTGLFLIFEFSQSIAWVLWKVAFSAFVVFGSTSIQMKTTKKHFDGLQLPSSFTIWSLMWKNTNLGLLLLSFTYQQRREVSRICLLMEMWRKQGR